MTSIMDLPKKTILYVDDDQDDCELFAEGLTVIDSTIVLLTANSGQQALDILFHAKNSSYFPSFVVLDMNMPVMDGRRIVEEMKKDDAFSLLPIVIFTTSPYEKYNKYWEEHNIKVISKPTKISEFPDVVSKIINLH